MAGVRVFWVFGPANDGRCPRMGNRKGISPEARRGEWKAVHSAREWGEFTRMLGGLTSVSAQISGANAPSQGEWAPRPHRTSLVGGTPTLLETAPGGTTPYR